jgi:hypothetical protein
MKLGTQTGSLINHMMANTSVKDVVLGVTGATLLSWSDRHPATVVDMYKQGKFEYIVVQHDDYKRIDQNGLSESQTYEYTQNKNAATETFRITDKGFVKVYKDSETGRFKKTVGGLSVGRREKYYDFSF